MCGIFGAIGSNIDLNKIKILGVLNNERGGDSAGIYTNKKCTKSLGDFYSLTLESEYPKKANKFVLGHTRKGSSGANTVKNAQPLVDGDHVFVLNGTIKNQFALEEITGISGDLGSNDTSYLLKLMKEGNTEFLQYYTGGATFVYRHKTSTTFWIGKSGGEVERPLHFCYIGTTMYFSTLERDLEVIAEGNVVSHFLCNSLITMNDKAAVTKETPIDRNYPLVELAKVQRQALALPYNLSFSTLDSLNKSSSKVLYCGGAYYKDNKLYTGVGNFLKDGSIVSMHENNFQSKLKFINGILVDIINKPSENPLETTALNIGLIDKEYDQLSKDISHHMLYYNADVNAYFFNQDELADGIIQPIGSETYYHFDQGQFIKMAYYSPQDFMDQIEELHKTMDSILFEFDKEDLDPEGTVIFETLEKYKEYANSNYEEWI